uniref:Uncharacterized protein n=1 Tax=Tanacetum cinerariifolium TaxID=118510 RepID=A0A699WE16_TANCI|nr:hypothetical protein [Tanacetum cinerariifolium]
MEALSSKAKKLRKKETKEEDTELEEEEVVKKVMKGNKRIGAKTGKPTKTVTYPTCSIRSSPKALYEVMIGLSDKRKKCLK